MANPLKPPHLRQRRNKSVTASSLGGEAQITKTPSLPKRDDGEQWHRMTRNWWRDIWKSPLVAQLLEVDVHRLYVYANLFDSYWKYPTVQKAAELRLQGQAFGLTPLDRHRLQWEVTRTEEAQRKRPKNPKPQEKGDPRARLQVVK